MGRYIRWTWFYLRIMSPGFLLGAALFLALYRPRKRRLARLGLSSPPWREGALLLLWMFSGGMAFITLAPGGFDLWAALRWGWTGPFFRLGSVNLTPFRTFGQSGYILLGNIVMFLPFGFLAALLWRGWTWRRALPGGFAVTGLIECWQPLVGRAFDIDDLLLNTLGFLCGYGLWRLFEKYFPRLTAHFQLKSQKEENL